MYVCCVCDNGVCYFTSISVSCQPNYTVDVKFWRRKTKLHVMCTQVEILWRLIQKLIVLMWLSVHMLTSQGLVCLLFLTLNVFKQQTTSVSALYKKQEFSSATVSDVIYSDRTDLSTESGSGPIQLARARYRTARRSVANRRRIVWMHQKARKNQWEMRIYSIKCKRPNIPKFTINIKMHSTK